MAVRDTHRPLPRQAFRAGRFEGGARALPEEVPVALSFNGSTQAVMMATPGDLRDFGIGFALTEGIAAPSEITSVEVVEQEAGIDVQMWLVDEAQARLAARRRHMAGPVGCGLCGLDSIEAVLRKVTPVAESDFALTPGEVTRAMASLPGHQSLHDVTRAAHAAAFFTPEKGVVLAREDVGRHNALDKLAGAMLRSETAAKGAVVLTSRVSIDMVQKCAALGAPVLIAVSAPTAHAVRVAEAAGITLVALARGDRFEVFTRPDRILPTPSSRGAFDVA
ncbi:formate dehydrogenase accessory sulfurtransferase FdhD [Acidimangrovimonas pyrenivorans]|uniref:Sulfur carrier protein FdhD n=1 Tax=Acidimangrovimonas pyrenivorans TaxID=2030798 RepID=A0ABV7AI04_9RHOB